MLLEADRPADARVEFEATIKKEQNRFRGLYGGARAAEAAGQRARAIALYKQLLQVASEPDTNRPELQHARTFVKWQPGLGVRPGHDPTWQVYVSPPRAGGWRRRLAADPSSAPSSIGRAIARRKSRRSASAAVVCRLRVHRKGSQIELARLAIVGRVTTLAALNSVPNISACRGFCSGCSYLARKPGRRLIGAACSCSRRWASTSRRMPCLSASRRPARCCSSPAVTNRSRWARH
jgi:hypothetical protein